MDNNSGTIATISTSLNPKTLRNPNPQQVVEEWKTYLESTSHNLLSLLLNQNPTRISLEKDHLQLQEDLICLMLAVARHHQQKMFLVATFNQLNLSSPYKLNQHSNLILEDLYQWDKWDKDNLQQQLQVNINNLIPLGTWAVKVCL